jgi:alpha-D-xyloside xylohydrolase
LYVRWTQFGALSPLMRAHGLRPREPWAFGPEALKIARDWVRLRYSLLPYLWNTALESAEHGWPMLRPLDFHNPSDRISRSIDDAFLLGRALLVVPVFSDSPEPVSREFYVPPGTWTDLVSGRQAEGPGYVTWECPLETMPLLVRDGTVLPRIEIKPEHRNTDDLLDEPWRYDVFGAVTETVTFRSFQGESIIWRPGGGGP